MTMTKVTTEPSISGGGGFHAVHAERDLESNWEVDLAKKLEEYLLKISSGQITGDEENNITLNFAEAALLLQGSIQVYSRKVEYLYTLVLCALEFLSQKRQQDYIDGASVQPEGNDPCAVTDEENDQFWGLDNIPVDEKNFLDVTTGKEVNLDHFIKPPANLVVLEGDCLDSTGGGGELESYLLSTIDLYQDFILLDTSDAVAVDEFVKGSKNGADKATSAHKNFVSPTGRSGGSAHKSSAAKSQQANPNCSPKLNCSYNDNNLRPSSPMSAGGLDDCNFGFNMDDGFDPSRDSDNSDSDDPWKPLNPHEPGNLRVKPFRKVKTLKKNSINVTRRVSMSMLFPVAKLHGPISPELIEMWEMRRHDHERQKDSQSALLYEKLRQTLTTEVPETGRTLNSEADNDDNEDDIGNPDFDMPWNAYMDEDLSPCSKEHEVDDAHDKDSDYPEHPNSQESLEDLCRSHLNALLASIAESEKQTEMAARVSTWKQRIEHHLEKQESHPPFDIRDYGERILDKLSLEESNSPVLPFSYLVSGQEKYDVARSFSSLLQLVNNGEVNLERNGVDGESVCYTDVNPFRVKLLKHNKKPNDVQSRLSKKRAKSPTKKPPTKGDKNRTGREKSLNSTSREYGPTGLSPPSNCKFPIKLGKASAIKLSPEAKRKHRSLNI
ncbi:PREDICTED: condensin-2 complex subunit H2-like isoform X2 [Lupinus angustifolius]|uniref:condensin-2 complex subunit H2-like isoform X2 n=1 Tax=Lupinus angustifolius TaxID=3871 RepID=UPI00092F5CB4|nr:PREDICTED: condensin-2 complex subunit H2-like isoform X2 [Lupinus angustifolius]